MRLATGLLSRRHTPLFHNVIARVGALVSLGLATLLVAREGGPSAVGVYALLRVLPGLAGVVISAGLPGAVAYFLAGSARNDPRLRISLVAMAVGGGVLGTVIWVAASPMLASVLFDAVPVALVAWAAITVLSQLIVATGKSCSQGSGDLPGANWVILLEEFMFLPAYGALRIAGVRGFALMIVGLVLADVATAVFVWMRLARRGFFRTPGRPSLRVIRSVGSYGVRAQIGGVLALLNLRLDFLVLSALVGTEVLGTYAIASKFAELLRIVPMALTYVLYPTYAALTSAEAASRARRMLPRASLLTLGAALPLAVAATLFLPIIYGNAFRSAIIPAHILILGLSVEGAAGVITAFLYGVGRPGLNSIAIGGGVVVTVIMDFLLIPRLGAVGAAWASTAAYVTSTAFLLGCFRILAGRHQADTGSRPVVLPASEPALQGRP